MKNIFKIAKYIDLFMVNPICYFFLIYSSVFYELRYFYIYLQFVIKIIIL